MPGPRYVDWTHLRVVGSREEAARYVPEARKLLGYVVQEAKRSKLGVFQVQRRLPDGALLVGEVHGSIPRITISPPTRAAAPQPVRMRGGFVAWPKSDTVPDGYHEEHPQAWLTSLTDERWATLYYDTQDPPWSNVTAPRGTYRRFADGRPMFPNGLNQAGNVDWLGPEDVDRLSWYGPRDRYHATFYDELRRLVFYRGKVLLDLAAYAGATGRTDVDGYVLGAAMKAGRLYVFTTSQFGYREAGSATHKLVRFDLVPGDEADGLARLAVAQDEAEHPAVVLWTVTRERAATPYFFNASVTQACRVGYKTGTDGQHSNELLTVSLDAEDNVSLAVEDAVFTRTISRTEIFPPIVLPGTVAYYHYQLDAPASALIARDFLGNTPKDVVVEYRYFEREEKTAQDGFAMVEWAEVERHLVLRVGDLEIPSVDQAAKLWFGSFGTVVRPDELLETLAMSYTAALDARFDAAAVVRIEQRFYGDLWSNGVVHEMEADCEVRVHFAGASTQVATRPIAKQTYNLAGTPNFETIIGGELFRNDGPLGRLADITPMLADLGTLTYSTDSLMPSLDRFVLMTSTDWKPGVETDEQDFDWLSALPILREPESYLFASMNPLQPGESLAAGSNFDPIERTAIAGARPRLHPAWALTPPKQPT